VTVERSSTVDSGARDSLIRLEHVSKTYRRQGAPVPALLDVSLEIAAGEFVAIMGRSGSGKSTLLHILGLLDAEYEGSYRLDRRVVSGLAADELSPLRNREIGFVFQQFHLLPQISIVENAALPALYAGKSHEESVELARERLVSLGLGDRLEHRPMELSIGQRQRAAIARALINRPKVVLADEPTGALDSKTAEEILGVLRQLNGEGVTLIMVTHDPEVGAAAQRIVRITDGRTADGSH
jgi:putative ABC transport system ATP-binding protein